MNDTISKPDANPILLAVLNLFLFSAVGYYLMGQQRKAMISGGVYLVSFMLFFWLPIIPMGWALATAYDAYLLGQKLQNGESIGMNEAAVGPLSKVFGG